MYIYIYKYKLQKYLKLQSLYITFYAKLKSLFAFLTSFRYKNTTDQSRPTFSFPINTPFCIICWDVINSDILRWQTHLELVRHWQRNYWREKCLFSKVKKKKNHSWTLFLYLFNYSELFDEIKFTEFLKWEERNLIC